MIRNRRLFLRAYLILVLGMALFGGWYASENWRVDLSGLETAGFSQDSDWVDTLSNLGEGALQLFLGFTSGQ
jgi:hypothetical protein